MPIEQTDGQMTDHYIVLSAMDAASMLILLVIGVQILGSGIG